MRKTQLYPLKFDPIYQYRLWGGRRLSNLLTKPLPDDEPIGEAWILSDRADHASKVTEGPLKGQTLTHIIQRYPNELMGKWTGHFKRFPLLLKFLDCKEVLSVQVHPSDHQQEYIPKGDSGKTEAWVVLETAKNARIYTGLKAGTNKQNLSEAITDHKIADKLHSFVPHVSDGIFIKSGTVHTLGGTVVFEVQENSDVTFRLYDWDRVDAKTGKPRELQVNKALACIDYHQTEIGPVKPVAVIDGEGGIKQRYFNNQHFILWRIKSKKPFKVGKVNEPHILVCLAGSGQVEFEAKAYHLSKGEVMLVPAVSGKCNFTPLGETTILEIGIHESK